MEKLSDLKTLHYQVQNNIFNILIKYQALKHEISTINSKVLIYSFEKCTAREVSSEKESFAKSIHRLIEIKFLFLVSGDNQNKFLFIKEEDYNQLDILEKNHHSIISPTIFADLFLPEMEFNSAGENL